MPLTNPCKFCNNPGHSSAHCHAKETGTILVLYNLLKDLLSLPSVPVSLIALLRNKAPPITIERLSGDYEDFAESSDDELDVDDKSTSSSKPASAEVQNPTFSEPTTQISGIVETPSSPVPRAATTAYIASTGIPDYYYVMQ